MTSLKNKSLLIVDDEHLIRESLADEFKKYGCKVFEAGNGVEAFKIVQENSIDLVITDIRMPEGSGLDLLDNIKKHNPKRPRVVLVTGFADMIQKDVIARGADSLILKPFELNHFISIVVDLLRSE